MTDKCKKCRQDQKDGGGRFPSCAFVESIRGSPGYLERIQCQFIDWLLLERKENPLAKIEKSGQLTLIAEFDIIPVALREAMEVLYNEGYDEEKFKPLADRYKAYINSLCEELIETHVKPEREASKAKRVAGALSADNS